MSYPFDLPPDRPLPSARHIAARSLLVKVTSTRSRRFFVRWRNTGIVVGLGVGLSVGGGVALAQGVFSQGPEPGSPAEAQLAVPVVATRTGTATIELGSAPQTANAISLTLTGLSIGTFHFPGTSSMSCSQRDLGQPGGEGCKSSEVVPLEAGHTSVTITTSSNASWRLRATYVHQVITAWKTNAHGQTYGVVNKNGFPDLVAVAIDRGRRTGYVDSLLLNCQQAVPGENFALPAYKSDGTTRIGTFIVGNEGPGIRTVPASAAGCSKKGSFTNPVP
jgi:hypothetical protein